jgi:peptidoglycan/xylan/chitin deacetylase (PgdA/CDA1 family)
MMTRIFYRFFLLLFFLTCASCHQDKSQISDYQHIFLPLYSKIGKYTIAIRVFKRNDIPFFLLVNPKDLTTYIAPVNQFTLRNTTPKSEKYATYHQLKKTPYYKLLCQYTSAPEKTKNQGITHASHANDGNILTIDFCPSSSPFEKVFFQKLVALSTKNRSPVPITVAISGLWLIDHPKAFHSLVNMQKNKQLKITWANHTFTHVYYHDLPNEMNFLRSPLVNMDTEIMLTEQYLLEHNQTPSVFFRFPGLVSSQLLLKKIQEYGLIPLGADAWIARNEAITPGGIILIHGNGNEPSGIAKLEPKLNHLKFIDIYSAIP